METAAANPPDYRGGKCCIDSNRCFARSIHQCFPPALRSRPSRLHSRTEFKRDGLDRSEEHTSELQSRSDLVCRLLLEKKKAPTAADSESARLLLPSSAQRSPLLDD